MLAILPITKVDVSLALGERSTGVAIADTAMNLLRELRGDMWDQNVPFNGSTIQEEAVNAGYSTRDEYVNAPKWDSVLQADVDTRLDELNQTGMTHSRPDGAAELQGATLENLSSMRDLTLSFQLWGPNELDALKATNGEFDGATNGHLYNFLNPNAKSYAFGTAENDVTPSIRCIL